MFRLHLPKLWVATKSPIRMAQLQVSAWIVSVNHRYPRINAHQIIKFKLYLK